MNTLANPQDEVLYDPLDGVKMPSAPASDCPLDDLEDREAQLEADAAYVRGEEAPMQDDQQQVLLRMLANIIEDADSRQADLGQAGGDHYWQGKSEVVTLARQGVSFDAIAEAIGRKPERIARLFTNRPERASKMLAAERYVRSGEWDGEVKSVMLMSDLPRATALLFLANLGVETNATKSRKAGGGSKWSPEQYEAIRVMRCEYGWSWKQIEKHTGVPNTTAIKIAQRKGWV